MKTSDFDYYLPKELIAQTPLQKRDSSRLLVYDRATKQIEHKVFSDIIDYLNPGDALVLNETRVIPARLYGVKKDTGAKIEFLLLKRITADDWEVILRPGRKAKIGTVFIFGDGLLQATVISIEEDGGRIVRFSYEGVFEEILDQIGVVPLPPYITATLEDKQRYQTVYAKQNGSAAAPTAGLHFTKELLDKIERKGIKIVYVLLHVGLGTFRPVKEEEISNHIMHEEYYELSKEAAQTINETRSNGGRIVTVGTTCVRVLETLGQEDGTISAGSGNTGIFISPGYKYKMVDALITNFHLPKSTLIMLVSALMGTEETLKAYETAVNEKYRFFSFGDAMYIK